MEERSDLVRSLFAWQPRQAASLSNDIAKTIFRWVFKKRRAAVVSLRAGQLIIRERPMALPNDHVQSGVPSNTIRLVVHLPPQATFSGCRAAAAVLRRRGELRLAPFGVQEAMHSEASLPRHDAPQAFEGARARGARRWSAVRASPSTPSLEPGTKATTNVTLGGNASLACPRDAGLRAEPLSRPVCPSGTRSA
jgi:hypothetical protein